MRQGRAVWPIQFPRAAKLAFAKLRTYPPKLRRGVVIERNVAGGVRGIDRYGQGMKKLFRVSAVSVQKGLAGMSHRFLAEDVYRTDDAAGVIFDRVDIDERHDARTIGLLDDDLLIAQSQAGRENLAHGTFRMRY